MARKTYNDEFKTAAAKLVREQGYSVKKAAASLGVDQGRSAAGSASSHRLRRSPTPRPRPKASAERTRGSARRTGASSWSARS